VNVAVLLAGGAAMRQKRGRPRGRAQRRLPRSQAAAGKLKEAQLLTTSSSRTTDQLPAVYAQILASNYSSAQKRRPHLAGSHGKGAGAEIPASIAPNPPRSVTAG